MPDEDIGDRWPRPSHDLIVHRDADAVAEDVAARLIAELAALQVADKDSPVHICTTGGSTAQTLWPALVGRPEVGDVDWTGVHVWFSDERFVPSGHPERNDLTLLACADDLGLPVANIHSIPGPDRSMDVASAAWQYAVELESWSPVDSPHEVPLFRVSLLGIGPDGHVASLFPGDRTDESAAVVAVVDAPKPPPQRVTFTRTTLRTCDQLWFVAFGEAKAEVVGRALTDDDPIRTPAAGVSGRDRTLWFVDEALARRL